MRLFIFTFSLLIISQIKAFQKPIHQSFNVHDENSKELIKDLRKQKRDELQKQNYPIGSEYEILYNKSTNHLIKLVKEKNFINDTEIDSLVYKINSQLSEANPTIKPIKKILIQRNGSLNAASMGEGTIILNLGLIAHVESQDELAFIIAHETAHFHLNHLRKRLTKYLNSSSYNSVERRIAKIPEGNMTLKDLEVIQSWYNNFFMVSREAELEADSLALIMYKKSGFNFGEASNILNELEISYYPKYQLKSDLFDELIFKEIPFSTRWMNEKKVQQNDHLFKHLLNNDSVKTHPHIDSRVMKLNDLYYTSAEEPIEIPNSILFNSQFELVRSFYKTHNHDIGIHVGLQLKKRFGPQERLDFQISRMLYEIAYAKNENRLPLYAKKNTSEYHLETKVLNNFFYNLTVSEASEISYQHTKKYFDSSNPDFYRLLYKIHVFTNRINENKKLKREFKQNFPKENLDKYSDADN